jgi:hypothetical protein
LLPDNPVWEFFRELPDTRFQLGESVLFLWNVVRGQLQVDPQLDHSISIVRAASKERNRTEDSEHMPGVSVDLKFLDLVFSEAVFIDCDRIVQLDPYIDPDVGVVWREMSNRDLADPA